MSELEYYNIFEAQPPGQHQGKLTSFEYAHKAEITNVYPLTDKEKLFQIRISDAGERRRFFFKPGQFVMLEVPGIGEAPFSISSSPVRHGDIELCIRTVGNLTNFLARVERGTPVGISGPFGTSFPMDKMSGHNIILIAGGLGIVPLRAPLFTVLENRSSYNDISVIYGAKNPSELLFTYQYDAWRQFDIDLALIVDNPDSSWEGRVGVVTDILREKIEADPEFADTTYVIACGPPVMFKFVCNMVLAAGLSMHRMFVSLERRMHCGRGKCCRCNIGSTYTCLDGPVFDYWSVLNLKEAI